MRQGSMTDATGSNRNHMNSTIVTLASLLIRHPTSETDLRQLPYGTSSSTTSVSVSSCTVWFSSRISHPYAGSSNFSGHACDDHNRYQHYYILLNAVS